MQAVPGHGARVLPGGGVHLSVWAPRAERVELELPGSERRALARAPARAGVFEVTLEGAGAGLDYRFVLDGARVRPDPASRHQPAGVHGPSRVVDPSGFVWSDAAWTGVERADLVLYELHVGTFTPAGRFEAVVERLAPLRALGVTALELMPVAEFPGSRNWGYDGVFPYAPQSSYGGPEGLKRLVDAAHAAGLAVILDVVYNHLGPEGNVLADFGPYFTDAYRTPWGHAVNFDGPESDEVRRFFLENARYWLLDFHVDGLRLDAVHAIHDESAQPFLAELAGVVRACEKQRGHPLHAIAESDANDPRLVREPARGGLGLDAVWSDDFHHAVHAALTGERDGYYADFGGVGPIAKCLADRFVYDGRHSVHRRRRHGAPARDVPTDRFVVCVQNHDQVGNRARGERLAALLPPERSRLATALLLLSPYVPLLFMGEEYGETNPFLYFVSHDDPALLEAVRSGRRREFAAFAWTGELPDPAAPETFERSRPDPSRAEHPPHAGLLALHRTLLELRRREPALRPGGGELQVDHDPGAGWITLLRRPPGGRAAWTVFHLGARPAEIPGPASGPWQLRFELREPAGDQAGERAPARLDASGPLRVAAETALLYLEASP